MAALVGALRVTLGANTAQYEAGMRRAQATARTTGASISTSLGRAQTAATRAFRGIAAAAGVTIGAAGIIAGARAFLRYADAAKNLEAQLRLATRASGSFAQAQEDVRRIAAETRSGLEETATLYATFQRNSRELGISQAQAARATETVSKSFLISGASAAEAAGGLRQFLQGVQSGTLRGEELNSVLENAPRLARLLADSLGVTIGELRRMGQEGELSAAKLITALTDRRFTAQIDEEFRQLPVTFDQAMTLVNNAAIETFGAFDRGGRFSEAIASFVTGTLGGMDDIAASASEVGANIRATFEGLADVFAPMLRGALDAFGIIGAQAVNLRNDIAGLLSEFDAVLNNTAQGYANAINAGIDAYNIAQRIGGFVGGNPNAPQSTRRARVNRSDMAGRFTRGFDRSRNFGGVLGIARGAGAGDAFNAGRPVSRVRPTASGGRKGGRGESAEARQRRHEREDQAFANELASLNEDLLAARQATVTAAKAIAEFEIQQINAARDRQNADYQAEANQARDRDELAQARAQQLIEANNAVAAERVRAVQLREQQRMEDERVEIASATLDNEMELEQALGALADTNEDRRASALRLLALQEEQERLELQAVITKRGINSAEGRIAQARLDQLAAIYQAQRQGVMDSTMGPLANFLNELPTTAARANEALQQVAANGLQAITDGLADAIMMTRSWGDVFKNVAKQIIGDLLRIQIQQRITQPLGNALNSLLGGLTGGSSYFGGSASSYLASIGHRAAGGPVLPGRSYIVGEKGPELLSMGSERGVVIANDNIGGGGVTVNQYFQPHFAGNAATKQEMLQLAAMVKPMAQEAYKDLVRRRG